MKRRWLIWSLVVAAGLSAVGAVAFALIDYWAERMRARIEQRNDNSQLALTVLTLWYVESERGTALPRGDVRDLYRWVISNPYNIPEYAWSDLVDPRVGTFRDVWGRELVYRFPPRRRDVLFELYSVGPNGIDEGGEGDDITCGRTVAFDNPAVRSLFKDGRIDPEWFWANLDRFRRDPETLGIIGAPPERFRSEGSAEGTSEK